MKISNILFSIGVVLSITLTSSVEAQAGSASALEARLKEFANTRGLSEKSEKKSKSGYYSKSEPKSDKKSKSGTVIPSPIPAPVPVPTPAPVAPTPNPFPRPTP